MTQVLQTWKTRLFTPGRIRSTGRKCMFFTFSLAIFLWFGSRQHKPTLDSVAFTAAFNVALFVAMGYLKELWQLAAPVTNGFVRSFVRVIIVFVSIYIFFFGWAFTSQFWGYNLDKSPSDTRVVK
jgi:hypothetical protein